MSLGNLIPLHSDGLSILNAEPKRLPGPSFLHELVPQAANDGVSAAIDFLSENGLRIILSYPELHAVSLALASRVSCILGSALTLPASTFEAQDPLIIPILAPQSPQLYVAILAALKVGGAFCPLNTDAPPDRVRFILNDVKAKIVLVSQELASKIPADDTTYRVIFIDDVLDGLETKDNNLASYRELNPEDLAYVMYTSGSTGTPKGVAISHLAATQSILAHERHIPPFSRFLQFAAPTFDVSVFEIFFPFFRGATLVGCNRAEMLTDLVGVLNRMEVDACELTPTVAGSLLRQHSRAPSLRLLLTIGEMLTEPVIREFAGDGHKMSILWGMYGPTEATIHCTVQAAFPTSSDRGTIGVPFDTVSAFVIRIPTDHGEDFQFDILPAGEVGELALGGLQLATCYLNKPEQTAASFLNTPRGRVYRTGDKAKIRPDGTIECLGRIDGSQVKLNGQRIELGEVEQVLLRTSGCHGAVAAVISNVLVAFAAVEQVSDSNAQLWAQCRSWLPAYMIPTDIVFMERLPQLPSGKVDKKRLVYEYGARTTDTAVNEEAVDDHERLLCVVATTILGEGVGPLTEFSAAKLDSLAAIEYASTLRESGIVITPVDILKAKTPRKLRQRIGDVTALTTIPESKHQLTHYQSFDPCPEKVKLKPALGDQVQEIDRLEIPTPLQQSMISETLKGAHLYINQIELELISHVTLDALQSSLRTLAECNEILRTGFAFVETQLCQVIWKRLDDAQLYDDVDGKSLADGDEDIELFLLRPLRIGIRPPSPRGGRFALLLTLHHAIYDGWTIDLIIEDLSLLLSGGLPIKRPQFSQVMRHLNYNSEVNNIDSMEFWTEHLRGVGAATTPNFRTIAVTKPQRAVITTKIPFHPKNLNNLMLEALIGPQVLFQACLIWLWAAVQGCEDVTIGCVSSGRSLPLAGIDKLMGPCMTTLPLRINTSRYRTIIELLQSIHSINRETLQHGHIPLSEIYKVAGLSTNSKLFDVIFAYQESPASRKKNSNIVREAWHRDATEAKLLVEIQPCEDHFICQATFQVDVLPQTLAEAFTRHLSCLVDHFSNHHDSLVEMIPQCFPLDSLSHFNRSPRTTETYSSLPETVENSALRFSSEAALCFANSISASTIDSQSLSYYDLNSKANQIARYLQQFGLDSGGVIAIIMNKSPLMYCGILGILKTGCAYLPILPGTPSERIKTILGQAEPYLCVVDTFSSSLIFGLENPKIIDLEAVALSIYSNDNLNVRSEPSNLAYVIYTSGTTGTPKGVAVTNKNILSNISILSGTYPHTPSDKMLQACSQAFDVSVFEIFFAWANGMCLCAATNDTLFEDFEHSVQAFGVTHLSLTVTVASLLNPRNVPAVKFLVTSGEPMTDEVLNRWSQYLYQGYGPSETTNICTVRKVSSGDSSQFLGWSFENTSTFVLHPNSMDLVPIGCIGELCFGGDQVAAGYLRLPEVTATKFIDHPIYGRLYRSGDLGRMLTDGSLIIHGRIDTQVKLHGLRIELQEIQAIALKTGLTRTCVSILVTFEVTNLQQLALFYVPSKKETPNFQLLPVIDRSGEIQTLRHSFQSSLPYYMMPTFIFPISALPLTSSGKIDEGKLRTRVQELPASVLNTYSSTDDQADTHSDWSETETLIASVITDSLKKKMEISRWTTFSTLGLDSISAMPVARKLQSILGKRIPLSLLLQNPTVSRLAPAIDELEGPGEPKYSNNTLLPEELVETIRKHFMAKGHSVAKVLPCTPLQEAMVMSSLSPSSTLDDNTDNEVAYYNQMLFRLQVPYEIMMRLWDEVVQRHEILRALFVTSDNIRYPAVQIILDGYIPKWQVLETNSVSLHERASQHITSASTTAPFDEPPMALAIIRTQESGDYLSFVCHHAMYDGISMRIILTEIEALYHGRQLLEPPSIESFLRETQLLYPNQDDFWRQLFLGFEPNALNCAEYTKDTMPRTLNANASKMSLEAIESQLRDTGVSMLALIQTAWAITLSILSHRSDVSFGSVIAGRSISLDMIDDLVAPCFNTLPIRIDISLSTFVIDVMKALQSLNANMMKYQFTALRHIQKETDIQTRLFDTLVILQPPTTPLDDKLWSLVYEEGIMDIPIVCEVIPSKIQDTLAIQLHRDISKFSYQSLQLVVNVFSHVLDACLRYPSSHIFKSEELPENWQQLILQLFHRPEHPHVPNNHSNEIPHHEETWSPLELTIRQTLAKLAEMPEDQIKRLTPIYQYGLDSITAIQLATLLRQQNISVSAVDVIEHPTCAGIAAATKNFVEDASYRGHDLSSFHTQVGAEILQHKIDLEAIEEILPCTATQQGLLSQFLDSKGRYYFNYSSWVLDIAASPETTAWAWSQLTNHHQILRTGFVPVNRTDSAFAMLVYRMNHFAAPVKIYGSDTFDVEKWLSDASTDSLNTLACPPWRLALTTPRSTDSEGPLTIHLAMHHALYDAFTLRILLRDLSELISHGIKPKTTNISHALSYYFSLVKSSQSTGEAFWKQKADGFVSHKFPIMTPLHGNRSSTLSASRTCEISSSRLRQAASKASLTVQAALQATWVRLLSAYIGESRVSFGVVLDGRTTEVAQKTTLPMVITIPVIADNVASNSELLEQMMQYNSELRRFQFMSIAQIQRSLGTADAMFDTILIYQATDRTVKQPPFRVIKELASVEYPISLEVEESLSDTTQLNLVFNSSILPQEQATLLLAQFEAILVDLLFSAQDATSHFAIDRPDLFAILSPSCESLPIGGHLLHELPERSAHLMPSVTALEFIDEVTQLDKVRRWTYQELDDLGNQVAHFITQRGINQGSIVATCFNKCPIAYFVLLGILKAGCTFLCLDPSAPATRQTFILDDSNAAMLIIGESFYWAYKSSLPVHMVTEGMLESLPTSPPSLQRQILPSDSCYCLYTSGTTGTPKGCLISHGNAVQAMAAFTHLFDGRWDTNSRWLQFAAFHFDVSVLEQYWSWYVGIVVVTAPKDVILSDLATTISKLGITHIDLTPSLARLITPDECPSLCKGVFITGGEKLRSDILEAWGTTGVIHNAYGPTEATIGITMYRGVPENGKPSNIGNLFPNVGAYVFEPNSEIPVLRGGVGELCVSGKLVGKGYLNREALTEERFPTLQASGERVYRTGDLVRVLHDDSLDFLGRADDQVKLRGQRLEIGEINHAIRDGLADKAGDIATIVTRRKAQDIDLLVSFISLSSNSSSGSAINIYYDADHIQFAGLAQEACRSRLAAYMVPSFIICVSKIPLSTNNKVDINQLKKLFSELSHKKLQTLSAPSLPSHRELDILGRKVLKAIHQVVHIQENDINSTTTIFQLGIDSITATRLARQLRMMGLTSATSSIILRHPQIGQLSQALSRSDLGLPNENSLQVNQLTKALRQRYLSLVCGALEVNMTEVEYIAPCTPLQHGIIARSKVREAQLAYFNQFQLCLDFDVSIDRLKASLSRIVASYSILRTAFVDTPDGFVQVAIKNRPLRWFEVGANMKSFEQTITERRRRWIEANHDVLKWLVEVDHMDIDGQHYLLLRLFHGLYDARSLSIILESLESEYKGIPRPSGPAFVSVLPEGPLLNHLESHQFWKSLLKNHRFQPMPSLIDKPTSRNGLTQQSVKLEGLEDTRKRLQVTHQTLLQAAWLYTLRRYFDYPPTIGVILSGRSTAVSDIDLVVGPLFNTLPLRVDLTDNISWVSLTREIQEHNNGLLTFVHTPLRDIQKLCTNGQPLFDTLFTFDRDYKTEAKNERTLWLMNDSPSHPDYPLAIEVIMIADDTLRVTLAAQAGIANEAALDSLYTQFIESLNLIIASINSDSPSLVAHSKMNRRGFTSVPEPSSSINNYTATPKDAIIWDEKSYNVRRELAILASVDEQDISETTNLFALGLDSIDIIKLAGRLTRLGYHVSVGTLMKQPTLENIVTSLEKSLPPTTNPSSTTELDGIIPILGDCYHQTGINFPDFEAILPPTPLQDSMVAEMLRSDFHTYFNHDVLKLPPDINIDRLKSALLTVYANSPILRTVFIEVDDPRINSAYCQVVRRRELEFPPTLKISTVDDISMITNTARLRALGSNGTSNLFQVHFVEFETDNLIVLSIAHALYDGWSLDMLHKDIQAAYESDYIPRQPYEPYLSRMISQSNSPSRKFWADLLHEANATLVPKANTTPESDAFHRLERQSRMSITNIKALCKDLRVTPQVLGQACWAAVLASLTKSLDVVFGVVLSGRDTEEAQGLMFPTMNTVPLRLALHGTIMDFLWYCQDIMSSVVEFQHTPLRDIQNLSPCHGDKLFNTIFLLQNSGGNDANTSSFLKSTHSVSAVDYPLCAELDVSGDSAVWHIACDKNYMSIQQVRKLGASLERALEYFTRDFNEQVLSVSSHGPQTVSICGLTPVVLQTDSQKQGNDLFTHRHISQQTVSSPQGYEILLDVLSDLSKVDRHVIDINLSIFHIGLDSISAIKASSMLRKRGLEIPTRDLLTAPSIRDVLEQASQTTTPKTESSVRNSLDLNSIIGGKDIRTLVQQAGLQADSVETILPVLPMQVHMLSVWQNSGGATFFPKFAFKVSGPIDLTTVSRAWVTLVSEIAMLRTHLVNTTSPSLPFLQVILDSKYTSQHATSISTESDGRWEFVYAATPFAIAQFLVAQEGEADLILYFHHALYDGMSLPIILNRFAKLAELCSFTPLVAATDSWQGFALKHLDSSTQAQRETFWTSYLNDNTAVQLYKAQQAPIVTRGQRVKEFQRTALNSLTALRLKGSAHGLSTQALLFAAYAKAFAKQLHQDKNMDSNIDCIFGIYLANRSGYPAIEDVPFPTLNVLPLRVKDPLRRSATTIAADIQKDITEISRFENSTAGLWEIHKWTGVRIDTFVNILSRLDEPSSPGINSVTLKEISNNESPPLGHTDISTHLVAPDDEKLSPNTVIDSYPEGVDIELALREDVLDLGIFGPSSILSTIQASDMAAAILAEINAL
ncbi:putative non-ribosomal peptide synthetase [Xylaria digitata]|nr:putative non-ribosomal peptide synthetase [Xylaria digitata]